MDIEGTYTIQATPEDVWLSLMDTRLLQETIPGLEHLELLEEPNYTLVMQVKQAPLMGAYRTHVTVTEQLFPSGHRLAFTAEGRQSTINGTILLTLSAQSGNTVVAYKCTLNSGKQSTLLPTPLVKGNIKHLFQQFFTNFAGRLRASIPSTIESIEVGQDSVLAALQPEADQEDFYPSIEPNQPALLLTLVHLFKLGEGDPQQEARWVNRLRRVGVISGLLFLVWVGTRLPRRHRA